MIPDRYDLTKCAGCGGQVHPSANAPCASFGPTPHAAPYPPRYAYEERSRIMQNEAGMTREEAAEAIARWHHG